MTYECEGCNRTFRDWHAVCQHMRAFGHWACETCNRLFDRPDLAEDHMDRYSHWAPRYECEACDDMFMTSHEARRHMEINNHFRQWYCQQCDKGFQNENNLRMHLNGNIHRGSSIACPFCRRTFTSATGVTHHLENSSCPKAPGLNRENILAAIRERDPNHVLTKKLLTYPTSSQSKIIPTSQTWNGYGYECYLCHKEFTSLTALKQHVNSPTHEQKVYHCPGRMCGKEFVRLAALFSHLESESCGTMRFETVQKKVGGILSGKKMISW